MQPDSGQDSPLSTRTETNLKLKINATAVAFCADDQIAKSLFIGTISSELDRSQDDQFKGCEDLEKGNETIELEMKKHFIRKIIMLQVADQINNKFIYYIKILKREKIIINSVK